MLVYLLKEIKKKAETMIIQNIVSKTMTSSTITKHRKVNSSVMMESLSIKENMQTMSENLGHSVKGKFGTRVKDTFNSQIEKIDKL